MDEIFTKFVESIKKQIPPSGGIPYHLGEKGYGEPTVLFALGLIAQSIEKELALDLGKWLQSFQNPEGSVGHNPDLAQEGLWLTSPFIVLAHHLGLEESKKKAIEFQLSFKSMTFEKSEINELDTTITGWPWVKGTFGWVCPTSWALIALQLTGNGTHERVAEGRKFLIDRCIPEAGWNTGNKKIFNSQLFPFFDTTSLAALALGESEKTFLLPVLNTLEKGLETCDSIYSCSWGCICLEAFGFEVAPLKKKIGSLVAEKMVEEMDLGQFSMALIATASKKVLTA